MDVELTSARDDGTWTWRAAGARQPRGNLDANLLYEGARVGDVVRADAEFALDGIAITHLYPPRVARPEPPRLEVLGPDRDRRERAVTTSLLPRSGRERRGPRADREPRGGPGQEGREKEDRGPGARSRDGSRRRAGEPERASGPRSRGEARTGASPGEPPAGGRRPRVRRTAPVGDDAGEGGEHRRPAASRRPQRLNPRNTHRAAALASLAPEQRPVAEQVLRGGLPGVRQAIEAQNLEARAAGRPEVPSAPLLSLAEQLLPLLKAAAWRDRAEAALTAGDDLALRDLRSVVTSADAGARDDETRLLAAKLREALDRRVSALRQRWTDEITGALDADKVLRALRASARPPDPAARFPAELALRLSQQAGAAMAPETPAPRWAALLEAVAASPVRRTVKPLGLPSDTPDELREAAKRASGRVPALAGLLGIAMPPPPAPPVASAGRTLGRRPLAGTQGTDAS